MRLHRFLFIVALYAMAAGCILVVASSFPKWLKYKFSSEEAVLFLMPEPQINGPDDERAYEKRRLENGYAVRVNTKSGKEFASSSKLTSDQYAAARTESGLKVLFVKIGSNRVEVIGSKSELESPWGWLVLGVIISAVAQFARKLWAREAEQIA